MALSARATTREVWAWNLAGELGALLAALALADSSPGGAAVAVDTEFPGALREASRTHARACQYEAMRRSVDLMKVIQLGVVVAGAGGGEVFGAWNFNMHFDVQEDLHLEASIDFLRAAGLDFARHAAEGIPAADLGRVLATSALAGRCAPRMITFSGLYDHGYLLKLLTAKPLPEDLDGFEQALAAWFPKRFELRDRLPHGSLESLVQDFGVERQGAAHTAASDALATLELFQRVALGPELLAAAGEDAALPKGPLEPWAGSGSQCKASGGVQPFRPPPGLGAPRGLTEAPPPGPADLGGAGGSLSSESSDEGAGGTGEAPRLPSRAGGARRADGPAASARAATLPLRSEAAPAAPRATWGSAARAAARVAAHAGAGAPQATSQAVQPEPVQVAARRGACSWAAAASWRPPPGLAPPVAA